MVVSDGMLSTPLSAARLLLCSIGFDAVIMHMIRADAYTYIHTYILYIHAALKRQSNLSTSWFCALHMPGG